MASSGGDEAAETAIDVGSPCIRTNTVTFVLWHETNMGECYLCLAVLLSDVEYNIRVFPLSFVLGKVEVVIDDVPGDLLARYEFSDFYRATMNVTVAILKYAKLVGVAFNIFRPPASYIQDRVKYGFRILINGK